jgi:3-oxoacyl-[acyl-carrier protein] reductase
VKILILGATKGLGKEIALECQKKDWNTIEVGSSITDEKIGNRTLLNCDLRSPESVALLIDKLKKLGPIDQFFWVAGRLLKGDFIDQDSPEIYRTIDINFRNAVPIVHFVWTQLQESMVKSNIVAIASSSGKKPRFDEAVYVATKFAQVGFMQSLGLENKNENLKISLILPGGMKTQLWDRNPTKDYASFLDPSKVASKIMSFVSSQQENYAELEIPRGSL